MNIKGFLFALALIIGAKFALAGDVFLASQTSKTYEGYALLELVSMSESKLSALLPEDADRSDMAKQRRAIKRGMYWSTSRTIKPLEALDVSKLDS